MKILKKCLQSEDTQSQSTEEVELPCSVQNDLEDSFNSVFLLLFRKYQSGTWKL